MPESVHSINKGEQVEALNIVQSSAIQVNERGYLNVKAIKQQVRASLASSRVFPSVSINHASECTLPTATSGFEGFNQDPSCHNLTEDEINTFPNYGIPEHSTHHPTY